MLAEESRLDHRPTSTASFVQLQQSRWEWKLVGMKVKLPGTVWGIYAQNEETRAWARAHARQLFEVIVRNVVSAHETGDTSYLWIVQHNKEEPFTIRAADLLPHIRGTQRQALLALGAPVPEPVKASKAAASRRKPSSEQTPTTQREATATADDMRAGSLAEKTAGDVAAHSEDSAGAVARREEEDNVFSADQQTPAMYVCDWANEMADVDGDGTGRVGGESAQSSDCRETTNTRDDWLDWDTGEGGSSRGSCKHADSGADSVVSAQPMLPTSDGSNIQDQRDSDGVNDNQGTRDLLFALHIKVSEETRLNLQVFEGDVPQALARQIAARYNLGKEQESLIAEAILTQADAVEEQRAHRALGKDELFSLSSTLPHFPVDRPDATDRNAPKDNLRPMYSSTRLPWYPHDQGPTSHRVPTEMQQVDREHRRRRRHRPDEQNQHPGKKLKPHSSGPSTTTAAQNGQRPCPVRSIQALRALLAVVCSAYYMCDLYAVFPSGDGL